MRYNQSCVCGRSSSGRARPCQGRGSEFEPRRPLQKETPSERMVFLFGVTRAEARTGHERSEKNVPVARFGARVRVAALGAASEPSQEAETGAERGPKEKCCGRLGNGPRCTSRPAATFVPARRGAALKAACCICHRQRCAASCPRCVIRCPRPFGAAIGTLP